MTQSAKYTIQLGTAYDKGQHLIWTLRSEHSLKGTNTIVPRTRFYGPKIAELVENDDGSHTGVDEIPTLLDFAKVMNEDELHFVLNLPDLMQPARHFCPVGDWFFNLGLRAAKHRCLFSGSEIRFMISLRNPASLLSEAWSSGKYRGFDDVPPDPFALKWATVLRDLRDHVPDAPIVAWCAEESPCVWPQVLATAVDPHKDLSVSSEIYLAKALMNEEGAIRLLQHLEDRPHFTQGQRARVIEIFLDKFSNKNQNEADISIPERSAEKQHRIDNQYANDLADVAKLDGVHLIRA